VGSIPGGVVGIVFHPHYAPGVDSASTMLPVRNADNVTTFISRLSRNLGVATSWISQGLYMQYCTCRVWKKSMPKLRDVIGGTKTKIYCQAALSWTCDLAVPRTIRVVLSKVGYQNY